jgi:hypothetical protein
VETLNQDFTVVWEAVFFYGPHIYHRTLHVNSSYILRKIVLQQSAACRLALNHAQKLLLLTKRWLYLQYAPKYTLLKWKDEQYSVLIYHSTRNVSVWSGAMPRWQMHMRVRDARVSVLYILAHTVLLWTEVHLCAQVCILIHLCIHLCE